MGSGVSSIAGPEPLKCSSTGPDGGRVIRADKIKCLQEGDYFYTSAAVTSNSKSTSVSFMTAGGSGDSIVYVKKGSGACSTMYDAAAVRKVKINNPQPGTYSCCVVAKTELKGMDFFITVDGSGTLPEDTAPKKAATAKPAQQIAVEEKKDGKAAADKAAADKAAADKAAADKAAADRAAADKAAADKAPADKAAADKAAADKAAADKAAADKAAADKAAADKAAAAAVGTAAAYGGATPRMTSEFPVKDHAEGALVGDVPARGCAAESTLQEGDVIKAVDGQAVKSGDDYSNIIAGKKAGDVLKLTVKRVFDNEIEQNVELELAPTDGTTIAAVRAARTAAGKPVSSKQIRTQEEAYKELEAMRGQCRIGIRIKDGPGDGIYVDNVAPKGPGDRAGLKEGMTIFTCEGIRTDDNDHFLHIFNKSVPGEVLDLKVEFNGKPAEGKPGTGLFYLELGSKNGQSIEAIRSLRRAAGVNALSGFGTGDLGPLSQIPDSAR